MKVHISRMHKEKQLLAVDSETGLQGKGFATVSEIATRGDGQGGSGTKGIMFKCKKCMREFKTRHGLRIHAGKKHRVTVD